MKSRFPTKGEVITTGSSATKREERAAEPTECERVPRRMFLVRLGVTVAAAGVAAGCGSGSESSDSESGAVSAGNVEDVPIGHVARVPGKQFVIARDTEGLYALSTICTHLGCDMAESGTIGAEGLSCACHGSRFSLSGAVLEGPATRALAHYKVDLSADGMITIQAGTVVQSSVRTPVLS